MPDSIRIAQRAVVSVVSDSTHPLVVRQLIEKPDRLIAFLTNPAFTFIWSILVGLLAFAAGRIYEHWNDQSRKNDAKWTSARLTRRYLLLARDQIRALVERLQKGNIAEAHVNVVLRAVDDFEEIKTRMVVLEDDQVEEAIYQWNLVAGDDLRELQDRLALPINTYVRKHGVGVIVAARDAAIAAALESDAGKADEVIAMLNPYLKLRNAKRNA